MHTHALPPLIIYPGLKWKNLWIKGINRREILHFGVFNNIVILVYAALNIYITLGFCCFIMFIVVVAP